MTVQIWFVAVFFLNLLLTWLAVFIKKLEWYRLPGSLIFVLLPLFTVFSAQPRFELDFYWWRVAGIVSILLGLGILLWAKLVCNRSLMNMWKIPSDVIASGPYQYIRHPLYLGLIFILVGWWWVWAAVYAFYFGMFILALIWIQGYLEEKLILEKRFGDKFREYRQRTGMFWIK